MKLTHDSWHLLVNLTIGNSVRSLPASLVILIKTSFITCTFGQFDQTSFITRTIDQNDQLQIPTKNRLKECSLARPFYFPETGLLLAFGHATRSIIVGNQTVIDKNILIRGNTFFTSTIKSCTRNGDKKLQGVNNS